MCGYGWLPCCAEARSGFEHQGMDVQQDTDSGEAGLGLPQICAENRLSIPGAAG